MIFLDAVFQIPHINIVLLIFSQNSMRENKDKLLTQIKNYVEYINVFFLNCTQKLNKKDLRWEIQIIHVFDLSSLIEILKQKVLKITSTSFQNYVDAELLTVCCSHNPKYPNGKVLCKIPDKDILEICV
jgi:hypothetical protein